MEKYNAYDNELTEYIDLLTKQSIKDIVGDIVGDVLEFDIPVNIPKEDHTFQVKTPKGPMTISIKKLFSKKIITFSRKIDEYFYEEYTVELDNLPTDFLVHGLTLEKRERGMILTDIIRCYDYCNHDDACKRLIGSEETRFVFDYNKIEKLISCPNFLELDIENQFPLLQHFKDLARLKGVRSLLKTVINLRIPNYIAANYRRDEFPSSHVVTVNNSSPILLFDFLSGNKTLERADDLFHGRLTSKSIQDVKTIIDYLNLGFSRNYIYCFNYLYNLQTSINGKIYEGRLKSLEEELIGPSLVNLPKEYYEYIRELILDTFAIELGDTPVNSGEVVELLKKSYRRDLDEETKTK